MPIDYEQAAATLEEIFEAVQQAILVGGELDATVEQDAHFDTIFQSRVQAYRETLLGCALARLQDRSINIRLPYAGQGEGSFNGRTLDEKAVNPFLQRHRIPCSRGPYLAVFRRSVRFEPSMREGVRDKKGFDVFLDLIGKLETLREEEVIRSFIANLLYKFAKLREAADVPISRLQQISLEQFGSLVHALLNTPSGGRFPVILVVAALRSIRDYFGVDWDIQYQGINVADAASGVGGDITVTHHGAILFAAEVTERPLEKSRVVATFQNKISLSGVEDYLFFIRRDSLPEAARKQAAQYFAQGYEVNFVVVDEWLAMVLATIGKTGRRQFNDHLIQMIGEDSVPRSLKVAWNEHISSLTSV